MQKKLLFVVEMSEFGKKLVGAALGKLVLTFSVRLCKRCIVLQ